MRPTPEAHEAARALLVLSVPVLSVVVGSEGPARIVAAAGLAGVASTPLPPWARAVALGVAVGQVAGPALELPIAWLLLGCAAALSPGRLRWAALAAGVGGGLVGVGAIHVGTLEPLRWVAAVVVAAALPHRPLRWPVAVVVGLALLGGVRAVVVHQSVAEASVSEAPAVAESAGAAWLSRRVIEGLTARRLLAADATARDRAWVLADLGAPRLGLVALGWADAPGWEQASLLAASGRIVPARVSGRLWPPATSVPAPGVVLQRDRLTQVAVFEFAVEAQVATSRLRLSAAGDFVKGSPELELRLAGHTLGPVQLPDEGGEWTWPIRLSPGYHRLQVRFDNAFGGPGARRAVTDLVVSIE